MSNGMENLAWDLPLVLRALAGGSRNPDGVRDGSDRDAVIEAARDRLESDTLSEEQRLILVRNGFPELDE
jgi:hypothetical protein